MTRATSGLGELRSTPLRNPSLEEQKASRVGRLVQWLADNKNLHFEDYQSLWQWSVSDLPGFWRSVWEHFKVVNHHEPDRILDDRSMPGAHWFTGARLNYAENALSGPDDAIVVIAISQTRERLQLTRGELRDQVARARAGLQRLGVRPGDRVAGYLPNIPEAVVAMLATVSLGAVWSSVAPEFGTQTVLDRFSQVAPKVLIAVDGYKYADKNIVRTDAVRTIREGLSSLTATVGVSYLAADGAEIGDISWNELTSQPAEPAYEAVPFDHPLWILFSSGTTGLPKAITHGHGGIVVEQIKSHALQTDLGRNDTYFVYCTTSWVMWNILVSALLVEASIVLMDGNPAYPNAATLWHIVSNEKVTAFGCGASVLVQAAREGVRPAVDFDMTSLRSISSTGSPLPPEAFEWVYREVGSDIFLQSSSGGTDICGAFVGGSPLLPVRAGEIAGRCLGVDVHAFDPEGAQVIGVAGELVVSSPMPSMPIYFWNDPEGRRYKEAYFDVFPGKWRHGDWIVMNEDGSCVIQGRSDGTLNRGGVRLGTAEFYNHLSRRSDVEDCLVVHLEDSSGGLGRLLLFVTLPSGSSLNDQLTESICSDLRQALSPRHVPDRVFQVPQIPYGLTGKKLEVPVKRILQGAPRATVVSDGALRDSSALDKFQEIADLIAQETAR